MIAQNSTDFSGKQFGNYELETLLKHRAASDLYLARDIKLDQPVFVEILREQVSENPELAGRFQRRMETVAQIKKDNIAPVIETGVTDSGYAFAVIEYIQGVWMSDMLADWRENEFILPVNDALLQARDIADALSTGHSSGLIHHDLRPDNILISEASNRPIIIDLGVPVTTNMRNGVLSESRTNMLDYASPEELDGKAIGRRSNIYSLGIILYELLTGHRPELPTSSWDIFEHSTMPKEVPLEEAREGLSGETYRLVRNCLWRQEWSRFETADEVISAIDTAMLAEQSVPKAAMWQDGRNRWIYVGVPLLSLLVIVVGLVLLWSQFANAEPQGVQAPTAPAVAVATEDSSVQLETPNEEVAEIGETSTPLPTLEPTVTLTREAPPTSAMDTTVPVFGPLSDQLFKRDETISFAWIWLNQPQPSESFTVYIDSEDSDTDPIAIGTVDEPDNASLYRLDTNAVELALPAGSYLWQVRLEDIDNGKMIVESDPRRFIIAEEPTATPTNTAIPPTATASATSTLTPEPPTATSSPTLTLTPSAAVVCVQERPFGWVEHRVQAGETISTYAVRGGNIPIQRILDANCLTRSSVLSINQFLYIPAPPVTATFTPRPTSTAAPTFTPGAPSSGGGSGIGDGGDDGESGGGSPGSPTDEPKPTKTKRPIPVPGG